MKPLIKSIGGFALVIALVLIVAVVGHRKAPLRATPTPTAPVIDERVVPPPPPLPEPEVKPVPPAPLPAPEVKPAPKKQPVVKKVKKPAAKKVKKTRPAPQWPYRVCDDQGRCWTWF